MTTETELTKRLRFLAKCPNMPTSDLLEAAEALDRRSSHDAGVVIERLASVVSRLSKDLSDQHVKISGAVEVLKGIDQLASGYNGLSFRETLDEISRRARRAVFSLTRLRKDHTPEDAVESVMREVNNLLTRKEHMTTETELIRAMLPDAIILAESGEHLADLRSRAEKMLMAFLARRDRRSLDAEVVAALKLAEGRLELLLTISGEGTETDHPTGTAYVLERVRQAIASIKETT